MSDAADGASAGSEGFRGILAAAAIKASLAAFGGAKWLG
jgi:hypothetical protein